MTAGRMIIASVALIAVVSTSLQCGRKGDGGVAANDASIDADAASFTDAEVIDADANYCQPGTPMPSDASVNVGDASCSHPVVIPDCIDGWCIISAGCFMAGSPETEPCRGRYTEKQVQVFLTQSFYISETEVTQSQWENVGLPNPGKPIGCADCPVNFVSKYEAFAYCNAMSDLEGLEPCYDLSCCTGITGEGCGEQSSCVGGIYDCNYDTHMYENRRECRGYRLPTGVEWEYAARAGTTTATYAGDVSIIDDCISDPVVDGIAWHCGIANQVMPVGLKTSNPWGVKDILGNVYEWVDYMYDGFSLEAGEGRTGPLVDPKGPSTWGEEIRGGSYVAKPCNCKAARRLGMTSVRSEHIGFRVARTIND